VTPFSALEASCFSQNGLSEEAERSKDEKRIGTAAFEFISF
jgi:hypothetical protein